VKSEDTPRLGNVVHKGYGGTFKVSEDDLAMDNDDANTSSRKLCQCIYRSPQDSSISSTDTAAPVELQLLQLLLPAVHFSLIS
jgi:hypothetical protein